MNSQPAAEPPRSQVFLVVDDDDTLRTRMEKSLQRRGFQVVCAADFDSAIEVIGQQPPDLALLDLKMPGRSGLELLEAIRRHSPHTRCVMLTGYGSISNAVEAIKLGAVNYVTKPADADQILLAFGEQAEVVAEPGEDEGIAPPSLAEAQWEHIQRVLSECNGNISEAARVLDIPRRTLQRKLKKLAP